MDDDWLMQEDEVNERDVQLKMLENQQAKEAEKLTNQGYKDGLDWADEHFKSVDIAAAPILADCLEASVAQGKQAAQATATKFQTIGALK